MVARLPGEIRTEHANRGRLTYSQPHRSLRRRTRCAVYSTWLDKHEHEWFRLGQNTFPQNTSIAAISRKPNSIDLFAVGADGGVYTAWWNEGWQDWSQLGEARFAEHTPITALAREANHIDLFTVGPDGGAYSTWWDNGWHDWFPIE